MPAVAESPELLALGAEVDTSSRAYRAASAHFAEARTIAALKCRYALVLGMSDDIKIFSCFLSGSTGQASMPFSLTGRGLAMVAVRSTDVFFDAR